MEIRKRRDVFSFLSANKYNMYCFQDTHYIAEHKKTTLESYGVMTAIFKSFSNSREVAIIMNVKL